MKESERKKRNILVGVLVLALLVISSLLLVGAVLLVGVLTREEKQVEALCEELSMRYGKNSAVFYTDGNTIWAQDQEIQCDKIDAYDVTPLYVTQDTIYFLDRLQDGKRTLYKADHAFSSVEAVYSYRDDNVMVAYMRSEHEFCYMDEKQDSYIYDIENGSLVLYTGSSIGEAEKEGDLYLIEKSGKKKSAYLVTDRKTGEQKSIQEAALLNLEAASYLDREVGLSLRKVWCEEDRIFVQCLSLSIVTTYEYDFDIASFVFLDWVNIWDYENYKTFIL